MTEQSMLDPSPQDVGARFETRDKAEAAVRRLATELGVEPARVEILDDEGRMHALRDRESRATGRALVRWHAILGGVGFGVGTVAWIFGRYAAGSAMFIAMPLLSLLVFAGFGAIGGLLVAGLLSARPGKGWLATAARDDARAGLYPVVVHAADRDQAREALDLLARSHGDPYVGRAA